jgi:hypothetical protein
MNGTPTRTLSFAGIVQAAIDWLAWMAYAVAPVIADAPTRLGIEAPRLDIAFIALIDLHLFGVHDEGAETAEVGEPVL